MSDKKSYHSFSEFYPYYLSEHQNSTCRALHVIGTLSIIVLSMLAALTQQWALLWLLPVIGYGFAWIGHFVFEKNRPATFQHPFYSLIGDFRMTWDLLLGRISK